MVKIFMLQNIYISNFCDFSRYHLILYLSVCIYVCVYVYIFFFFKEMFLEHQICILQWFLKDHVTLKIEVMAAENSRHLGLQND